MKVQLAVFLEPPFLRAGMGRGSWGLRWKGGLVGPTQRGSGHGPRGAEAPTKARRGGPRGGVAQPRRQGEPEKGQLPA